MISIDILIYLLVVILGLGGISYYLINKVLTHQEKMYTLSRQNRNERPLPVYESTYLKNKVLALERFMLLVDRISPENLVNRVAFGELSLSEYESSLLLTVQKEYEFNGVQQLYVSEQLWEILTLTKQQVFTLISEKSDQLKEKEGKASELFNALVLAGVNQQPCETAKQALRQEAMLLA